MVAWQFQSWRHRTKQTALSATMAHNAERKFVPVDFINSYVKYLLSQHTAMNDSLLTLNNNTSKGLKRGNVVKLSNS
jgi:hypothetical protein